MPPKIMWRIAAGWLNETATRICNHLLDKAGWWCVGLFAGTWLAYSLFSKGYNGLSILPGVWRTMMGRHPTEATSHFVNVLAFLGTYATLLALLLTLRQLRDLRERITGYRKFYEFVLDALKEVEKRRAKHLYIYGPTILPGNISYEDEVQISKYEETIRALFADSYKALDIEIISPGIDGHKNSYEFFYEHYPADQRLSERSPEEWWQRVNGRLKKACDLLRDLHSEPVGWKRRPRLTLAERTEHLNQISSTYFLSNGVQAVIAQPLHYFGGAADTGSRKVGAKLTSITPHLLGIATRDKEVINALETRFRDLSEQTRREPELHSKIHLLYPMYSRHLLSPRYVAIELKNSAKYDNPSLADLSAHDQDHFGKTAVVQAAIEKLKLGGGCSVLDIGAGLGGPARLLADKGCHVTGIELQRDRFMFAQRFNEKLGLAGKITLVYGDAVEEVQRMACHFSHIVSWLSILHMTEKATLLKSLGQVLRPGGEIWLEDYCRSRLLTAAEEVRLESTISCRRLLTLDEYKRCLEEGGITEDLKFEEMNEVWLREAEERLTRLRNSVERQEIIDHHGIEALKNALEFAEEVVGLFNDGVIFGIRVSGTKPPAVK